MSRKKRMFDIDMPDDAPVAEPKVSSPDGPVKRRGPMASAISENAGALTERANAEAKIREENDALAHEYVALKRAGLVIKPVPLGDVVTQALVRDRKPGTDYDLPELITSIQEVGLSNPIRVSARGDGKYELIQGYRRLSAYKELAKDAGEAYAQIPAVILPRGEGQAALYRQMVDENLIRKDISFAEMAMTAQAYAADPHTKPTDVDAAVKEVFKSANYQRRSYIRAFARLLDLIGTSLLYPEAISRNLGLALNKRIEEDSSVVRLLKERLSGWENRSVQDEVGVLRSVVDAIPLTAPAKPATKPGAATDNSRRPRTTFEVGKGRRRVRCVAGVGQLTLKMDRDLTAVDRKKLEHGIARLLDSLD
ncbi:ParB/RepB/Spo0J family partition protein [Yoonia sp.]|uniref:ParB/RepB/Spo0J family partition protein n=1 Tax=Yoonia sp. TaxID=2212373 RepID=UPI00358E5F90